MINWLKKYQFFYAVATLIGMIIGAGTFGIPYVMAQAGFSVGFFYLLAIGLAVLAVHLFYGEIILRTRQSHRLVGYAAIYLGPAAKKIATFTLWLEYYGALLVYTILGGQFLNILLGRFFPSELIWAIVFFSFGVIAVIWGLRGVAASEFIIVGFMLFVVAVFVARGLPVFETANLGSLNLSKFFLPYGVILFAMAGSCAIPEMRQILKNDERQLKKAIVWGTVVPIIVYFFFALIVVGVSGTSTSEEAITGLTRFFGQWIVDLGAFFGILAVFTSFIVIALGLKEVFTKDYRFKKKISFFLTFALPLFFYLLGFKNFILLIGFIGAVASGLDGILTILIYFKAKKNGDRRPEYSLKYSKFIGGSLLILFALGLIYQIIYLF